MPLDRCVENIKEILVANETSSTFLTAHVKEMKELTDKMTQQMEDNQAKQEEINRKNFDICAIMGSPN